MINKQNITAYIRFLYKRKNNAEPPVALIDKWRSLSDEDIKTNLSQLYNYWNFSVENIQFSEKEFLSAETKIFTPPKPIENIPHDEPVKPPIKLEAPIAKKSGVRKGIVYTFLIVLGVISVYVLYQFMQFGKMHTIYTLTQNVSIRDENGNTVGNFALLPNNKTTTYTELIAVDTDIYPLSIDSSDKKYDFRKVVFEEISFMDYLQNNYKYGYVNANYVIEDKMQFDEYKRIFGKFQVVDNNRLKLSQRKVIFNVLKNSKSHQGSYVLSGCKNASKYLAGFLSNELVENTRFQIIAKLEDGYFYSFVGDLNSNTFEEPVKVQLDGNNCNEDYLFKYSSGEKGYRIYNCAGGALSIKCLFDNNKMISGFETEAEPEHDYIQPLLDTIGSVIKDLVN